MSSMYALLPNTQHFYLSILHCLHCHRTVAHPHVQNFKGSLVTKNRPFGLAGSHALCKLIAYVLLIAIMKRVLIRKGCCRSKCEMPITNPLFGPLPDGKGERIEVSWQLVRKAAGDVAREPSYGTQVRSKCTALRAFHILRLLMAWQILVQLVYLKRNL